MATLKRIGIDSNLFIYVLEKHPDFYRQALDLFTAVESGVVSGRASELVYLEILSKTSMTAQEVEIANGFLYDSGTNFIAVSRHVLVEAASLRRSVGLKTPDAIHIASASINGCDWFVTNDTALIKKDEIDGVKIVALKDLKL